jgi:hypothetical protein
VGGLKKCWIGLLLGTILLLIAVISTGGIKKMSTQIDDAFFETIGLHLKTIPPSSLALLSRIEQGQPVIPVPEHETAIEEARSWLEEILKPAYRPSKTSLCAAFPFEEGICDTVRCRYTSGKLNLEVSQARHVIAITIKNYRSSGHDIEIAERLANMVFSEPIPHRRIELTILLKTAQSIYGRMVKPPPMEDQSNWLDYLRWWHEGNVWGFITLKKLPGITREDIIPDEESNQNWFSIYSN